MASYLLLVISSTSSDLARLAIDESNAATTFVMFRTMNCASTWANHVVGVDVQNVGSFRDTASISVILVMLLQGSGSPTVELNALYKKPTLNHSTSKINICYTRYRIMIIGTIMAVFMW